MSLCNSFNAVAPVPSQEETPSSSLEAFSAPIWQTWTSTDLTASSDPCPHCSRKEIVTPAGWSVRWGHDSHLDYCFIPGLLPDPTTEQTLIVAGGWDNRYLDSTEILRPPFSAWKTVAALPHKMWALRGGAIRGYFYVAGGSTGSNRNGESLYTAILISPFSLQRFSGTTWRETLGTRSALWRSQDTIMPWLWWRTPPPTVCEKQASRSVITWIRINIYSNWPRLIQYVSETIQFLVPRPHSLVFLRVCQTGL